MADVPISITNAGGSGTIDGHNVLLYFQKLISLFKRITIVYFFNQLVSKVNSFSMQIYLECFMQVCLLKDIWVYLTLLEHIWLIVLYLRLLLLCIKGKLDIVKLEREEEWPIIMVILLCFLCHFSRLSIQTTLSTHLDFKSQTYISGI